jgi:hypothetical protein
MKRMSESMMRVMQMIKMMNRIVPHQFFYHAYHR